MRLVCKIYKVKHADSCTALCAGGRCYCLVAAAPYCTQYCYLLWSSLVVVT